MSNKAFKRSTRKTIYADLSEFCMMAKEHDIIEITEWISGEGFDIEIQSQNSQRFQLTWGEIDALKHLIKHIYKKDKL
jgi:hypothetical protein